MPLPQAPVLGRITRDPELRYSAAGKAVLSLCIASNDRYKKGDEWVDGDTTFLDVVAFGQLAENVVDSGIKKGDAVIALGKLRQSSWEKDGQKRSKIELVADSLGADLRWTRTAVQHVERGSQTDARDPWAGGAADVEPPF